MNKFNRMYDHANQDVDNHFDYFDNFCLCININILIIKSADFG